MHYRQAPLAAERPLYPHGKTHRFFFRAGAGIISNWLASTVRSPSQLVRLHGKPHRLFFRAGARMEPHQFGQIFCTRDRASEAPFALFFYLPPSVGLLLTILGKIFCARLRSRMRGIFRSLFYLPPSVGLLLTILCKVFCTRLRSRTRGIFRSLFIYRRASVYSSNLWNVLQIFSVRIVRASINSFAFRKIMWSRFFCSHARARASVLLIRSPSRNQRDPDFSVRVFASEHQFVCLQGTISTHLFLWPGDNLDGAVTILGSGPGWN